MCLIIKRKPVLLTATKNIVCYKRLTRTDDYELCAVDDAIDGVVNAVSASSVIKAKELQKQLKAVLKKLQVKKKKLLTSGPLSAATQNFEYVLNKLYKTDIFAVSGKDGVCTVEEGFHSWTKKRLSCNVMCVIPKGATYYKGDENGYPGYTSSQIIIKKVLNAIY